MTAPRILVVDDEPLARERILKSLKKWNPKYQLKEAGDGLEALEVIESWKPNIVFLDIEMPEMNGFEVLMAMEKKDFQIIFQTAYDEFAIKAFEVSACDYLLKPFADERLKSALDKAIERSQSQNSKEKLEDFLAEEKKYLDKLVIKSGLRMKYIEMDEVHYFLSEDHVTSVFIEDVSYAIEPSLSYLEKHLDPSLFIRIHRNAIISKTAVIEYTSGTPMKVQVGPDTELKVSRDRKKSVKEFLTRDSLDAS